MATIWFCREGEIQVGPPIAQRSIDWCVKNLGLQASNWMAGPKQTHLVIGQKSPLGALGEYRFVVVEIDDDDVDAGVKGWKMGYYLLEIEPRDARRIINTIP